MIKSTPQFTGVATSYVICPGDSLVMSAMAADYLRRCHPEYDAVEIFAPDSDTGAVRDGGQIVGCRALVAYPVPDRTSTA